VNEGSWRAFHLLPDDVLFFRDGKPSTRGSDHYLRSLFPPHPSTLYGALRTRRLIEAEVQLEGLSRDTWSERLGVLVAELGEWGGFGSLQVRGPWMVRSGEALLPAPADLGLTLGKSKDEGEPPAIADVVRFRRAPGAYATRGGASHDLEPLAPYARQRAAWRLHDSEAGEPRPAEGWFLTPAGLAAWRGGGLPAAADFVHASALWCDEPRTGIGLEAARRLDRSGDLYTFGFIRLRAGVGLGFEVAGSALEGGGRVRLGGEGRTAMLVAGGPPFPAAGRLPAGEALCLALATPGLSEGGAYPPGFAAGRGEAAIGGRSLRLLSAVVPRSATVGGWDLASQSPKALRRALPAGSTFLFEAAAAGEAAGALDGSCISDFPAEGLARQGFGLAVAGLAD
jgi:CRISPR-associated protein Cmr3